MPFYFEDQVLDATRRELSRGGKAVMVEPKVFDLLIYLVANRDRLVTKDDLIAQVWQGRIVSDSALTSAINAARAAIGDSGREQRLIRTSSRKGFRFIGSVSGPEHQTQNGQAGSASPLATPMLPSSDRSRDSGQAGGGLAEGGNGAGTSRTGLSLQAAPPLSMVVLPFTNLSSDPAQDYMVDGIVETLTTDLSRIPQSFVIARNTAFTYRNRVVQAKQIGQELGVSYLIQGSIQCTEARLRVTVQLIDATTDALLWAERFDRDRGDVLDLQDEIVTNLARTLDVELVSAESKRAALSSDPRSVDLTFRGWAAFNRGINPACLKEARQFFDQALMLDRDNVMALAGLADVNSAMVVAYMTDDRAGCLAATESMAMRALDLAPNEAKAHASLALVYLWTNRLPQSISEYERALALNRNLAFAHANIGIAKYVAGQPQDTEGHIAHAIRLSPRDAWLNAWCLAAGTAKLALCHDAEAVSWIRRAIEANRTLPLAHFMLASALALQGNVDEAEGATRAGLSLDAAFTVQRFRNNPLSNNPSYLAQRKRICDGMLAARVPHSSVK